MIYAERARQDVEDIYAYNARRSVMSAQRVEDAIRETYALIAEYPLSGFSIDEPNICRMPVLRYPYTVFYRVEPSRDAAEIARVVYCAKVKTLGSMPDEG